MKQISKCRDTAMLVIFALAIIFSGCASLLKPFSVESPRPDKSQLDAVSGISQSNVPVIANMQTDKQDKIAAVAEQAIESLQNTTDPVQAEAITNVAANAIEGIQNADGTAKILGQGHSKTMSDILKMNPVEYLGYLAGQTPIALNNKEMAYKGIKAGWEWTNKTITEAAGAGIGGGGIIGLLVWALRKTVNRGKLLTATAKAVNDYSKDNPAGGETLVNYLASEHSEVPVNAKKEFGLT